jgi:hypothetical protein
MNQYMNVVLSVEGYETSNAYTPPSHYFKFSGLCLPKGITVELTAWLLILNICFKCCFEIKIGMFIQCVK